MASPPFLINRVVRFIPPALPQVQKEDVAAELYRYADELHRHLRMAFEALNLDNNLADLITLAEEEQVPIEIIEDRRTSATQSQQLLLLKKILLALQILIDEEIRDADVESGSDRLEVT